MEDTKDILDKFDSFGDFDSCMKALEELEILSGWTEFMNKEYDAKETDNDTSEA